MDYTFGEYGKQITDFAIRSVAIQSDGKIVGVGGGNSTIIARFNTDGSPDNTFGKEGMQTTHFGSNDLHVFNSVALQGDGKIVAAGWYGEVNNEGLNNTDFAIARYNTDGSLDNTFSGDGKQTTAFDHSSLANSGAIQSDGKIIVGGLAGQYNRPGDFALARYNLDGTPD